MGFNSAFKGLKGIELAWYNVCFSILEKRINNVPSTNSIISTQCYTHNYMQWKLPFVKDTKGLSSSLQNPNNNPFSLYISHIIGRNTNQVAVFEAPYTSPSPHWLLPLHGRSCGNYTITLRALFSSWNSLISGLQLVVLSLLLVRMEITQVQKHTVPGACFWLWSLPSFRQFRISTLKIQFYI